MTNKTPKLITLVGLSGSGKSTYAETFDEYVIVASDKVREAIYGDRAIQDNPALVFEICHKSIVQNLHSGRNVIFDATNLRFKDRMKMLEYVKKNVKDIYCECHVIVQKIINCMDNDEMREIGRVGQRVIEKQLHKFQIPFIEEGWDKIVLVTQSGTRLDGKRLTDNCQTVINTLGKDFDQRTPHHNLTLEQHSRKHYDYVVEHENDYAGNEEYMYAKNAAYLHDYGKLFTHTVDESGTWHYYGHAEYGTYKLLEHCLVKGENDDGYDVSDIVDTLFYVNYHMLPFDWQTDKVKEKYKKIFGKDKFEMLMLMHEADKQGKDFKDGE